MGPITKKQNKKTLKPEYYNVVATLACYLVFIFSNNIVPLTPSDICNKSICLGIKLSKSKIWNLVWWFMYRGNHCISAFQ